MDKWCFCCRRSGNFKAIIGSHSSVKGFYASLSALSGGTSVERSGRHDDFVNVCAQVV